MENMPLILPNEHQILVLMLVGAFFIGIANLIILDAIRRKGLSVWHMFDLKIMSKLDARDYVKLFLCILLFFAAELLLARLMGITVN